MGANQSSTDGNDNDPRSVEQTKKCYYELLGIDIKASEEEIKKAYRRKALELHPDRNYGNVEYATRQFADVQSAYEVLSDPQERAWYDSHRDAILSGNAGGEQDERPTRITTSEDILRVFTNLRGRYDYSDAPTGFYGFLRIFFEQLADEEAVACDDESLEIPEYTSFGHADDAYEDNVRRFYSEWGSFTTHKTFHWKDLYRYSEAPDRRVRRLMEKENKRLRDEAIREFNDAVRSLVAFVKKRDPRYKPNKQSEEDRQKALRSAALAQAARSRAINSAKESLFAQDIPDWMKSGNANDTEDSDEVWAPEDEAPKEIFECVLCNKTFKSEKQYEAHEKSKKHLKAAEQVKRQIRKENRDLQLDDFPAEKKEHIDLGKGEDAHAEPRQEPGDLSSIGQLSHSDDKEMSAIQDPNSSARAEAETEEKDSSSDFNDDYATRDQVQHRLFGQWPDASTHSDPQGDIETKDISDRLDLHSIEDQPDSDQPKASIGKAKLKRAKKAAQKVTETGSSSEFECAKCQKAFPSRTRLFAHIKELGHAQAPFSGNSKGSRAKT